MDKNKYNASLILNRLTSKTILKQMELTFCFDEDREKKLMEEYHEEELTWLMDTFKITRKKGD